MTKKEKIVYLQKIKKYLKLNKLCDLYNNSHNSKIDYNNLRVVINETSETRLSEEKLSSFIDFINNFFINEILLTVQDKPSDTNEICKIIIKNAEQACKEIREMNK